MAFSKPDEGLREAENEGSSEVTGGVSDSDDSIGSLYEENM